MEQYSTRFYLSPQSSFEFVQRFALRAELIALQRSKANIEAAALVAREQASLALQAAEREARTNLEVLQARVADHEKAHAVANAALNAAQEEIFVHQQSAAEAAAQLVSLQECVQRSLDELTHLRPAEASRLLAVAMGRDAESAAAAAAALEPLEDPRVTAARLAALAVAETQLELDRGAALALKQRSEAAALEARAEHARGVELSEAARSAADALAVREAALVQREAALEHTSVATSFAQMKSDAQVTADLASREAACASAEAALRVREAAIEAQRKVAEQGAEVLRAARAEFAAAQKDRLALQRDRAALRLLSEGLRAVAAAEAAEWGALVQEAVEGLGRSSDPTASVPSATAKSDSPQVIKGVASAADGLIARLESKQPEFETIGALGPLVLSSTLPLLSPRLPMLTARLPLPSPSVASGPASAAAGVSCAPLSSLSEDDDDDDIWGLGTSPRTAAPTNLSGAAALLTSDPGVSETAAARPVFFNEARPVPTWHVPTETVLLKGHVRHRQRSHSLPHTWARSERDGRQPSSGDVPTRSAAVSMQVARSLETDAAASEAKCDQDWSTLHPSVALADPLHSESVAGDIIPLLVAALFEHAPASPVCGIVSSDAIDVTRRESMQQPESDAVDHSARLEHASETENDSEHLVDRLRHLITEAASELQVLRVSLAAERPNPVVEAHEGAASARDGSKVRAARAENRTLPQSSRARIQRLLVASMTPAHRTLKTTGGIQQADDVTGKAPDATLSSTVTQAREPKSLVTVAETRRSTSTGFAEPDTSALRHDGEMLRRSRDDGNQLQQEPIATHFSVAHLVNLSHVHYRDGPTMPSVPGGELVSRPKHFGRVQSPRVRSTLTAHDDHGMDSYASRALAKERNTTGISKLLRIEAQKQVL